MLDSSVLIDYFRNPNKAESRLVEISQQFSSLFISSITEFEIFNGATSIQTDFWNQLLKEITVLPFDSSAARMAVKIETQLKKQRKSIDTADLFIAAVAVSNGLVLDTLNRKHFVQIELLKLLEI